MPRVKSASEPLQERAVGPVPDRIAGRVGADGQVKPDGGTPRADVGEAQPLDLASLEPQELRMQRLRRRQRHREG